MDRTRRAWVLLLAAAVALLAAPLRAGEKPREECSMCGMWLDEHQRTRHVATVRGGGALPFCSLACASGLLEQRGKDVVSVKAADYGTSKLVDARKAFYVLGSDAPPVMSATSTVAFGRKADAEAFVEKHGGKPATFEEALSSNRH